MLKFLSHLFLIILVVSVQLGFLSGLGIFSNLNLFLVMVVFITLVDFKLAILWVLVGGVFLDTYSLYPWLSVTLSFLAVVLIARVLFENVFTNKSLGALSILVLISTLIYNLLFLSLVYLFYLLKKTDFYINFNVGYLNHLGCQILLNLVFLVIIFYLVNLVKQKISSSFLARR